MDPVKELTVQHPWLDLECTLAEGPLYDPSTSLLHFVDIPNNKVYHVNTDTRDTSVSEYDESVTCLALRRGSPGLACTTASGFAILEADSIVHLKQPIASNVLPHTRFNDGACDSKGRFFAGTIYNQQQSIPGQLYRYDPESNSCEIVDEGPFTESRTFSPLFVAIFICNCSQDSNGLGWSPDERILYFTDSIVNKIYAYDYEDGRLSNRRVFIDAIEKGFPEQTYCDGLCVDEGGGVWSARWGGCRIVRFTQTGDVDFQIIFPTALNVTSCCFGGPDNDQMFVTSAHCGAIGGDAQRQEQFPDSGKIFRVDLAGKYKGVKRHAFTG